MIALVLLAGLAGAAELAPWLSEGVHPPKAAWAPHALRYDRPLNAAAHSAGAARDETDASSGSERTLAREGEPKGGGKKALILSLLLPGAGEWSLGERGRATGFFIAEGAIWTHFVWYQVAGHLRKDDYIEQAQLNAGVGVSDADDGYWKLVGQYETSKGSGPEAYEEELRREARDLYPADPAAQDAWVAERLPSGDRAWSWSSPTLRDSYQETRERSRRAFDRSKYSIAAAILNRLVSAVDTQIVRRKLARREEGAHSDAGMLLMAEMAPDGRSGRLFLKRSF